MDRTGHEQDWSEEFQILYEYDPIVTECHDQLRSLGDELAERFRNEVVGNRLKAKEVTARIVAEHGAALRRYARGSLNEALKDVRQLGAAAEHEFVRVVDIMGEDLDVGAVVTRIEEKLADRSQRTASLEAKRSPSDRVAPPITSQRTTPFGRSRASSWQRKTFAKTRRRRRPGHRAAKYFFRKRPI